MAVIQGHALQFAGVVAAVPGRAALPSGTLALGQPPPLSDTLGLVPGPLLQPSEEPQAVLRVVLAPSRRQSLVAEAKHQRPTTVIILRRGRSLHHLLERTWTTTLMIVRLAHDLSAFAIHYFGSHIASCPPLAPEHVMLSSVHSWMYISFARASVINVSF